MEYTLAKDGNVIVNVDQMALYIPAELFDDDKISTDITSSPCASSFGEGFKIIALAVMKIAETPESDLSKSKLYTLNYPQLITTYPSDSKDEILDLIPGVEEPQKYKVLYYTQGDILMPVENPRNVDNCIKFLDLLVKGKIPATIAYPDIYNAWMRNFEINGHKPGVPALYMQYIISEIYRCRKDPTKKFRYAYGNDMTRNDYTPFNMRDSAAHAAVFNGQIFEHMSRMMVNGINITRRQLPQTRSPVEHVLY